MVLIGSEPDGTTRGRHGERPATGIARLVEGLDSVDGIADRLAPLVTRAVGSGPRRDALAGSWLGHPFHPLLVMAPLGCWSAAGLLDLLGERRAAQTLVGAGILTAVPAAATGLSDWSDTTGAERRVGFVHMACNSAALLAYTRSWRQRRRGRHFSGAAWSLAGAALSGAGGWLGGHLAYALGVGVDVNAFDGGPQEWTRLDGDVGADGPPLGTVAAAGAAGTPVAVVGSADGPRVLADRCSHRGGPLSEGYVEGECVRCPWHGSRFDLVSGEVAGGPAVVPQPVFEVRAAGSGLDVRRKERRSLRTNVVRPAPYSAAVGVEGLTDEVDAQSAESFPASDPPGNY